MRANRVTVKERKQTTLSEFTGIDTNEPKQVDLKRAFYMRNVMRVNGINRKRWGWEEFRAYTDFSGNSQSDVPFYALIPYKTKDVSILFAFNRVGIYGVVLDGDETAQDLLIEFAYFNPDPYLEGCLETDNYKPSTGEMGGIPNQVIEGFGNLYQYSTKAPTARQFGDVLYINWCGKTILFGKFDSTGWYRWKDISQVAYIPTTTVGITGFYTNDPQATQAYSNEIPNLLTPWRINKAVGKNIPPDLISDYLRYNLDGKIDLSGTGAENNGNLKLRYYDTTNSCWKGAVLEYDGVVNYCLYECNMSATGEYGTVTSTVAGYIVHNGNGIDSIDLMMCSAPALEGESNVEITYKASVSYSASDISKCEFSYAFGVDGNEDQLFVSGNPDHPNRLWYSAIDNPSYFPETWYINVGSNNSRIMGFGRLSGSALCIFKEQYHNDSSLYFATGSFVSAKQTRQDASLSNEEMVDPFFSITAGGQGEGALNHECIETFNGEPLFLSRNGVFGVYVSSSSTNLTRRYSSERSRSINKMLLAEEDLANAKAVVWNDKYVLSINGKCYVAEPNMRYRPKDTDYYQYEWYVWDNVPAKSVAVADGVLYFGTPNGKVARFVPNTFSDVGTYNFVNGTLTFDVDDNTLTINHADITHLYDGDMVKLDSNTAMYYKVGAATFSGGGAYFHLDEDYEDVAQDGLLCYAIKNGVIDLAHKYYLHIDRGESLFWFTSDPEGRLLVVFMETYPPKEYTFCALCPNTLYLTDVDAVNDTAKITIAPQGDALDIVAPTGATLEVNAGTALTHVPVKMTWITGAMNLGTSAVTKTLLGITIDADGEQGCSASFGYECRNVSRDYFGIHGVSGFDLLDFDFEEFTFEANGYTSYTKVFNERNFNYIAVKVECDSATDFVLHAITLKFKYNNDAKGVK